MSIVKRVLCLSIFWHLFFRKLSVVYGKCIQKIVNWKARCCQMIAKKRVTHRSWALVTSRKNKHYRHTRYLTIESHTYLCNTSMWIYNDSTEVTKYTTTTKKFNNFATDWIEIACKSNAAHLTYKRNRLFRIAGANWRNRKWTKYTY